MKINIEPYDGIWLLQFEKIKWELKLALIDISPVVVEHIGSTSVPGLPAKPIIDVNVGIPGEKDFDTVVEAMGKQPDFIYYEVFNESMPQRRLFVKLRDSVEKLGFPKIFRNLDEIPHDALNEKRVAHVHVWVYNSPDWDRHIAFRDYLMEHEEKRNEYARLKLELSQRDWENGMEYNRAKDDFIKKTEQEALDWYYGKIARLYD